MRRLLRTLAIGSMCVMTSCSAVNLGVEGLIAAPKLTQEQNEIHQALVRAVGNNITLKYPRSGSNRSAYVIGNIDSEPGDEALVFYEYTGAEKKEGLMVNVLDKNDDDEWVSEKEIAGAGSEVSSVVISNMGDGSEINVVIGYTNYTGEEKKLQVYNYKDHEFSVLGTDNYSLLETLDINSDGVDELIVVSKDAPENDGETIDSYSAAFLEVHDGELVKMNSTEMCNNVTSYLRSVTGKLEKKTPAVYIDELTNENQLQTEIICYKDDELQNPIHIASEKLLPLCTRPAGYYSRDIDGDGEVEIPSVNDMLGYENAVEDEKLFLTDWYVYEEPYELVLKYSGYYSISEGYVMTFPNRWNGQVTVKLNSVNGEAVFYKYNGDINGNMTELMRIAVVSGDHANGYSDEGYQLIDKKGGLEYMVKITDEKNEPLAPTIDEVKNCFYITD